MKKRRIMLILALSLVFALSGAGIVSFAAETPEDRALSMATVLQTKEGFRENGTAQVRTKKALAGEYSVTYNVSGVTPGNGWIAQQYIGIDDAGSFLQINLFVDSAITVNKIGGESAGALVIYDATTDQPMANPRSLELGGDWFTGANYIFKYEITKTRLHFYFGLASKIVEGTDAPVSRGYVLLDDKTYGEYTDGIASFAPYAADRSVFSMTVNSISVKGEQANLDMTSMEKDAERENVIANEDAELFLADKFENRSSAQTDFAKGGTFSKKWVSELPVSTDGLPNDADVFTSSFEIALTTSAGNYIPSGLQFGFAFGMPEKTATPATEGVTAICGKLPMAGLDLSVGNGTEAIVHETTIGDASKIFSANDGGIGRLYVSLIGKKDGSLKVTYKTDHPSDADATFEYTGIGFNGFITFFVTADDVAIAGESTGGSIAFQNILLPSAQKVDAESVSLSEESASVRIGGSKQLTATVKPDNTTIKTLTWTSSDETVATVDENGLVTAKKSGSTVVTATTENGLKASCNILVPVEAEKVTLDKTSAVIGVGAQLQLNAAVSPENTTDKNVVWASSDPSVATVDENGLVKAIAKGEAKITASSSNGKSAECAVTVSVPVSGVTLSETEKTIDAGDSFQLTATILPADAGNKSVSWSSSADNVAEVDENGTVTAKAAGTAVITVLTADGYKEATCTVTVKAPVVPVTGISLNKDALTLDVGGTETLKASLSPETATNKGVKWTSSDESIVKVSDKGVVTAVKAGTASITVTSEDGSFSATCAVTVNGTEKGGCGSAVAGVSTIFGLAAAGIAVLLFRKKAK